MTISEKGKTLDVGISEIANHAAPNAIGAVARLRHVRAKTHTRIARNAYPVRARVSYHVGKSAQSLSAVRPTGRMKSRA